MNLQPPSARLRPFRPVPFGRYTLLSPLSMGGMGEIFLARLEGAQGFEKLCVIKKILPQLARDPEFVERFVNEARILVKLSHGSIAQVLDVGLYEGDPWIALEFVDGKDLRKVAARARDRSLPLPLTLALYVMGRVLDALAYAHRKRGDEEQELGLVHRDVSPQNILISYEGEVKVIDFGLAKSALSSAKTHPSMILGKFLYMSPEQARHQKVDRRSDLYSAGLCLYELVCGRNPFDEVPPQELMLTVANPVIPPLHTVDPLCPPAVRELVGRALELDPDRRFQTAEEFRAQVQACLMEIDPSAGPESVSRYMREAFSAEYQQERRLLASLRAVARPEEEAPAEAEAAKSGDHETAVSDLKNVAPSAEAARTLAEAPNLPRVPVEGPIRPAPLSFAPTPRTREDRGSGEGDGETLPGVIVTEELRTATPAVHARPLETPWEELSALPEGDPDATRPRAVVAPALESAAAQGAAQDTQPRVVVGTLLEEPPVLPAPQGRVRTPTRVAIPVPVVEAARTGPTSVRRVNEALAGRRTPSSDSTEAMAEIVTGPVTHPEPLEGPGRSRALRWVAAVLVSSTLAVGGWFAWEMTGRPGLDSALLRRVAGAVGARPGSSPPQEMEKAPAEVPLPERWVLTEDAGAEADALAAGSAGQRADAGALATVGSAEQRADAGALVAGGAGQRADAGDLAAGGTGEQRADMGALQGAGTRVQRVDAGALAAGGAGEQRADMGALQGAGARVQRADGRPVAVGSAETDGGARDADGAARPPDESDLIEALAPGGPAVRDPRPRRASAALRQLRTEWAVLRRTYRVLERRRTCEARQMKMLCSRYAFLEGEVDHVEDEPDRIRELRTEVHRLNDDLRAASKKGR